MLACSLHSLTQMVVICLAVIKKAAENGQHLGSLWSFQKWNALFSKLQIFKYFAFLSNKTETSLFKVKMSFRIQWRLKRSRESLEKWILSISTQISSLLSLHNLAQRHFGLAEWRIEASTFKNARLPSAVRVFVCTRLKLKEFWAL